jgi:hypothetical protein
VGNGSADEMRQRDVDPLIVPDPPPQLQQRSGVDVEVTEELWVRGSAPGRAGELAPPVQWLCGHPLTDHDPSSSTR